MQGHVQSVCAEHIARQPGGTPQWHGPQVDLFGDSRRRHEREEQVVPPVHWRDLNGVKQRQLVTHGPKNTTDGGLGGRWPLGTWLHAPRDGIASFTPTILSMAGSRLIGEIRGSA